MLAALISCGGERGTTPAAPAPRAAARLRFTLSNITVNPCAAASPFCSSHTPNLGTADALWRRGGRGGAASTPRASAATATARGAHRRRSCTRHGVGGVRGHGGGRSCGDRIGRGLGLGGTAAAARTCSGSRPGPTPRCRSAGGAGGSPAAADDASAIRGGRSTSPAWRTARRRGCRRRGSRRGFRRGRYGCTDGGAAARWRPCSRGSCRSRACTRHCRPPRCRTWARWAVSASAQNHTLIRPCPRGHLKNVTKSYTRIIFR
ncbi:Os06g0636201 [Oryza sativa Japonica Group]|uniref:Os06g0636201 protein n=1 Tax=Oryza sativa subsp. japonica TaxID=39947 RepID=A0A0N7KMG7_ORYSJ|nr:hypothetical protein EE612_035535 [Oryza sativa]BAS98769.1 Os06g0636201 [Oryza sativa Japonica Group]